MFFVVITNNLISQVICARVKISSPIDTPREGELLSISCQVWDMQPGHEVTISRELSNGKGERLSWNDDILQSVDERVFLAIRRKDGSLVYFLTIMDVTRMDEGSYSCKIVLQSELRVIADDSMEMRVNYFPLETHPRCSGPVQVTNGVEAVYNCSSSDAFPSISLNWSGSPLLKNAQGSVIKDKDNVFFLLKIVPSAQYNGKVLVCTLRSPAFPERSPRCHIGPLSVTGITIATDKAPSLVTSLSNSEVNIAINISTIAKKSEICANVCKDVLNKSTARYWVITTWTTCLLDAILLLFCISLSLKMYFSSKEKMRDRYQLRSQPLSPQDVYERLECRAQNTSMYMTLEKPNNKQTHPESATEITYTLSPTAPDID